MERDHFLQHPSLRVPSLNPQLSDVPLGGHEVLIGVARVVNGARVVIALVMVWVLVREDDFSRRRSELVCPTHGFGENHSAGWSPGNNSRVSYKGRWGWMFRATGYLMFLAVYGLIPKPTADVDV